MTFREADQKAKELLARMTVEEKIGQLTMIKDPPHQKEELKERFRRGEAGSILSSTWLLGPIYEEPCKKNREFLNELQHAAVEESRLGIPFLLGKDVIHGHNMVFPLPLAMAASFDPEFVTTCYRAAAEEAVNDGIRWAFAPMVDLSRDPRWGRCVEGIGEDPYLGAKMAEAEVKGFQGEDLSDRTSMAACAKHFIGYGAMEGGRDYQKSELSDYTLRNFYLPSFRAAVKAGCQTIMSSFNEISGNPVTSSSYLLTEVLRDELGFEGFVVSDSDAVKQLVKQGVAADKKEASAMALTAGVDMEMVDECYPQTLKQSIEDHTVPMEVLDQAVLRVLRVKYQLGLFDDPYIHLEEIDFQTHKELACRMACETIVLLKNKENALPLSKNDALAAVGPYFRERDALIGTWTFDDVKEWVRTLENGLQDVMPDCPVTYYEDPSSVPDGSTVLVALGNRREDEGEAQTMAKPMVSEADMALLKEVRKHAKRVIGVLFYGRPMILGEAADQMDAILYCWHGGTEAGTAAARILFGLENPSARLPITLPRSIGQIPLYYNMTPSCREYDGYYGIRRPDFVTYIDQDGTPQYPFGYGLSYTDFAYSDLSCKEPVLSLDEVKNGKSFEIRVRIRNTGLREGTEVAQCYVRDEVASMMRPLRMLEGFQRVPLKPGEEKEVTFLLAEENLGFYGRNGKFVTEKGRFTVYVGGNCLADQSVVIEIN